MRRILPKNPLSLSKLVFSVRVTTSVHVTSQERLHSMENNPKDLLALNRRSMLHSLNRINTESVHTGKSV